MHLDILFPKFCHVWLYVYLVDIFWIRDELEWWAWSLWNIRMFGIWPYICPALNARGKASFDLLYWNFIKFSSFVSLESAEHQLNSRKESSKRKPSRPKEVFLLASNLSDSSWILIYMLDLIPHSLYIN